VLRAWPIRRETLKAASPLARAKLGNLKALYEEKSNSLKEFVGPFAELKDEYGLKKLKAEVEGGTVRKVASAKGTVDVFDTWYVDNVSWRTVIACMRMSGSPNLMELSCVHYFLVPEIGAMAHGRYMANADVADWKKIETEVRSLTSSYAVRNAAGGREQVTPAVRARRSKRKARQFSCWAQECSIDTAMPRSPQCH
jgi:hypothetical protein